MRDLAGVAREANGVVKVQFLDASGDVLAIIEWPGREALRVVVAPGTAYLEFVLEDA